MHTIKLEKQRWRLDLSNPLAPSGGFGEVFRGEGPSGAVAVKRLKVKAAEAAHRELKIGRSLSDRSLQHVVPILDYGQDADSDRYYLVMPICDRSLQDDINSGGAFSPTEAVEILDAILVGLAEVGDITHRDLKPSNILMHDSVWKIADFGIARFVEESTSLDTLKDCLTAEYAAPEQWRMERATGATDIYAIGCIAHALISGHPPFFGDKETMREQHLNGVPQSLTDLPPSVRALVSQMLRKVPEIRPSLARCREVMRRGSAAPPEAGDDANGKLAKAVDVLSREHARVEAEREAEEQHKRRRIEIFKDAARDLSRIKERLFGEIETYAKDVMERRHREDTLVVGKAVLTFDTSTGSVANGIRMSDANEMSGDAGWGMHKQRSSWDLIGYTSIAIQQTGQAGAYERCANIVFARPSEESEYRWYELAFWSMADHSRYESYPFCLRYPWEIDKALSKVASVFNLAHDPVPIDAEGEDSFIEYWKDVVAEAIHGNLRRPTRMPMAR